MLQHLLIRNIAIADNIDIDWSAGMTSISGETGAGKSILLSSLSLALGDRADSNVVRFGEKRAEVVATFDVSRIVEALAWLQEHDLDNGNEVILRRTVSAEGRSRAFINGQPVPLTELKTLGEFLIDIHSQHAHQSLLRNETHLQLLDDYAGHGQQVQQLRELWISWQGLARKLKALRQSSDDRDARIQLLEYQCEELNSLALEEGEVEQLENEFRRIQKSETFLTDSHAAKEVLQGEQDTDALQLLKVAINRLRRIDDNGNVLLENVTNLLDNAAIQVEEAADDLERYIDSFNVDEERSYFVEKRLDAVHSLARKHHLSSESLHTHLATLNNELIELKNSQTSLETLEAETEQRKNSYFEAAAKLSAERQLAAVKFAQQVIEKLQQLAMPGARFEVAFTPEAKHSPIGVDSVEYMISLNPGQPLQPMAKVASGGELSRISLAIQVICAEHSTIPTLVFDEVDVGISGATAEIVGHMLREVGTRGQVICVTHQPQVASLGHHHCIVAKQQSADSTTSTIQRLNTERRIDEIARMLGGIDITAQTRAHAEEMLRSSTRSH
jgi:DNA repair protein RecN (Recombination protein N)